MSQAPLQRQARFEQGYDGGAQMKDAHLVAALDWDGRSETGEAGGRGSVVERADTNAANDGGAHHHQGDTAVRFAFEMEGSPVVAHEQVLDVPLADRVHGEQVARDSAHGCELAGDRRMYAVIVTG